MMRWLLSLAFAIALFVCIVLALGLLLKKGERDNEHIKLDIIEPAPEPAQFNVENLVDKEEVSDKPRLNSAPIKLKLTTKEVLSIQLVHTDCETKSECTLIHLPRELGCALPINRTGYLKLLAYFPDQSGSPNCLDVNYRTMCVNNQCSKSLPDLN